jgi:hypothetical protein
MKTETCSHVQRWKHLGTVIHGTLRSEDLIDAFYPLLEELDPATAERLHREYDPALDTEERDSVAYADAASALESELFNALDSCAPLFLYFGALEGDGSDFGFWFNSDSFQDAQRFGVVASGSELPNEPKDGTTEFCVISDRGNVTLYAWCQKHGWQEVYGIV